MQSRPWIRFLLWGAGAVLVLALAFMFLFRSDEVLAPRPTGFDPGAFLAGRPSLDAPQVATGMAVVDAMLSLAEVRPDDYVVDLGSGDGRILIAAARSAGAHGLGVDIDPAAIETAGANARAAGVTRLVAFRNQDLFETPLAEADVLTLYLTPEVNLRLRPRILAQMRPGARVVSHDYTMGEWRWDRRQRVGEANVYVWIVPARIEGAWTLTANGRAFPLAIDQSFQTFTGTAGETRTEQGRISGDRIRFIANLGRGRQVFEGRLDGNAIVPVDASERWRAVRAS